MRQKGNSSSKNTHKGNFELEPLKVRFYFLRNETMVMRFNQEILVPGQDTRRQLNDFSDINVTRDLLEINFELLKRSSDDDETMPEFNVTLTNWYQSSIFLQFNFSNPLLISEGRLQVKIKNREMFLAKQSGIYLAEEYYHQQVDIFPPKQLPRGYSVEKIETTAKATSNMVTALLVG